MLIIRQIYLKTCIIYESLLYKVKMKNILFWYYKNIVLFSVQLDLLNTGLWMSIFKYQRKTTVFYQVGTT